MEKNKPFGRGDARAATYIIKLIALAMMLPVLTHAQAVPRTHASAVESPGAAPNLDSLLRLTVAVNPTLRAARARARATAARVSPAGVRPDPVVTASLVDQPFGPTAPSAVARGAAATAGPDPMTMYAVGVAQTLPYPGKLGLQTQVANYERDAADAMVDGAVRQIVREVKEAYYDVTFDDRALAILQRNADAINATVGAARARYSVGLGEQQDVLRAQVEATRLADEASAVSEQRRSALARLNALLDRPSNSPVGQTTIPQDVERAATVSAEGAAAFTSIALGARAAGSPIPAVATLQDIAIRTNPDLRAHEAMLAAQAARVELARKTALPDISLSLMYGYRAGGLPGMVSAGVSVPVPVHRRERQDQGVLDAEDELEALHAEHVAKVDAIRADVARLASDLERSRAQLALYTRALIPQARAALTSATASYQTGRVEFVAVIDGQTSMLGIEMEYARALTDFAKSLAALEQITGQEILP